MFKDIAYNYQTDKFTGHQYIDVYDYYLTPRKSTAKNVLEIGIQNGGSMQLWHDYLDQAQIYGVDVIALPDNFIVTERMTHIIGDAYTVNFIQTYFPNRTDFDILIDDGPHSLASMLFFAQHYSKLLSEHGVLIIEDIPDINWTIQIISAFPDNLKSCARIIDNRYINNRWDDILVVLEK